jgi:EAL domain-containing protein (putative c-di-GMP-specific phosphodiesterase class I)
MDSFADSIPARSLGGTSGRRPGTLPYLEHFPEPGGALHRVRLSHFPCRLGRDASADLVVYHPRVSKFHAVIVFEENDLWIRDLGSTNGTFVNGRRIAERVALTDGDIIHLGEKEFLFVSGTSEKQASPSRIDVTESALLTSLRSLIQESKSLHALLESHQVTACFQPIVTLPERQVVAYEGLGRGRHAGLPTSPGPLFALAEKVGLAAPLSRAFRQVTLVEAASLPHPHTLFLNMHPSELPEQVLESSLADIPDPSSGQKLVLEIHENVIADPPTLHRLQARLHEMDIGLAFDDFGVGQTRLAALAQVQVDFIKLDRTLVQSLPCSPPLRELMRSLVQVCSSQGTQLLAEGIETEEEAEICCALGCTLAQGYLFSRPKAAADLLQESGVRSQESGVRGRSCSRDAELSQRSAPVSGRTPDS